MRATFQRRAATLLLVLWAIVVLSLLAGGLSFVVRQDLAIANIERDRLIAHCLARAGVERAVAEIMNDTGPSDTLGDSWCDNTPDFGDVGLTGGTFSVIRDGYEAIPTPWYGAGDESTKLNVNVATREQLLRLPNMTGPIAGAIIDWRDQNEEAEPDGIERGYYASRAHPYEIRNGPFRTVRELLLVRGVTPELLYGEDRNVNGLLDPEENDGDASEPHDNADGRLDRGWFAYLTVYSYELNVSGTGQKRLNLNDAGAQELSTRLGLETWAAESIVKARQQKKFEHLADLLDVQRDPDQERELGRGGDVYVRSEEEKDRPVTQAIFEQIVDELTLKDEELLPGRININTTPPEVLATLPGVNAELAEAVVRQRDALVGYTSIGQLLNVSGITKNRFVELEELVTVRSNVFRIHSHGRAASGLTKATIECVVDRGSDVPRVLYWLESSP